MREPSFDSLKLALHSGGVAPQYIRRTVRELEDHYADIEREARESGCTAAEAAAEARAKLGSDERIAMAVLAQPALKDWTYRWPRTAEWLRTGALFVLLPAAPVLYCAYRGTSIMRWSVSASLALLVTSGLLLCLQWMIAGQ